MTSAVTGWLLAISLSVIIGSVGLYVYTAERAKDQLVETERAKDKAEAAARDNAESLLECTVTNAANKAEADRQAQNAHEAAQRVADAEERANHAISTLGEQITRLRARGLDCPAIDADFRDWLRE